MWASRDKNGSIRLYIEKPVQKQNIKDSGYENCLDFCTDADKMIGYLPSNSFPELKWGDEPIEVFVFTKEFVQRFGDACYKQGIDDGCAFEEGHEEDGNLLIDYFINQ